MQPGWAPRLGPAIRGGGRAVPGARRAPAAAGVSDAAVLGAGGRPRQPALRAGMLHARPHPPSPSLTRRTISGGCLGRLGSPRAARSSYPAAPARHRRSALLSRSLGYIHAAPPPHPLCASQPSFPPAVEEEADAAPEAQAAAAAGQVSGLPRSPAALRRLGAAARSHACDGAAAASRRHGVRAPGSRR